MLCEWISCRASREVAFQSFRCDTAGLVQSTYRSTRSCHICMGPLPFLSAEEESDPASNSHLQYDELWKVRSFWASGSVTSARQIGKASEQD